MPRYLTNHKGFALSDRVTLSTYLTTRAVGLITSIEWKLLAWEPVFEVRWPHLHGAPTFHRHGELFHAPEHLPAADAKEDEFAGTKRVSGLAYEEELASTNPSFELIEGVLFHTREDGRRLTVEVSAWDVTDTPFYRPDSLAARLRAHHAKHDFGRIKLNRPDGDA